MSTAFSLSRTALCFVVAVAFAISASTADSIPEPDAPVEYYFDKHNSAAYPDGSCNTNHFGCLKAEPKYLLQSFAATSPYDCCKTCLSLPDCQSWTHYYENVTVGYQYQTTDHPRCKIYSVALNYSSSNITAGNCVNGEPYARTAERPNFVLYYPDTVRAEYLSVYGYPLKTSPFLEEFATEGVVFDNHIAQHSECSPSRISMLTGRYMHNGGKRTLTNLIQAWEPSYLRWLKDSGYYVLWLGKNDALSIASFPLTCNEWHGQIGVEHGSNLFKYGEAGYYSFWYSGGQNYGNNTANGDYKAIVTVENFLKQNNYSPPEPFAIFIPGIGGHPPYGAPKPYHTMWKPEQVQKAYPLRPAYIDDKPDYFSEEIGIPHWHNLTSLNFSFFYNMNAIYLGMLTYTDWNFGQLWSAIKDFEAHKGKESVATFMTSDHGDYSGDHRFVEKWPGGMDDQLIHIPLLARIPNMPASAKGKHMTGVTESFDIGETMLDLANVNKTYATFGRSLRPQLQDSVDGDLGRYGFSEGGFYWHYMLSPGGDDHLTNPRNEYWPKNAEEMQNNFTGCPRVVAMRGVTHKLVYRSSGVSEFYDLSADPKQMSNLWNTNDTALQMTRNAMLMNLTHWYLLTADLTPILTDPRGLPPGAPNRYQP